MRYLDSRATVLISVLLSLFAGYITYGSLESYEDVRLTATTFATLAATLFGFLMTSLSILIAISDRDFIKNLRLTGHYKVLVNQLFGTAGLLLLTLTVAVCGHVLSVESQQNTAIAAAAGLLLLSLFSFIVAGAKFKDVVVLLIR